MDASFWIKLSLSFLVGSLWVTLTTLSAEHLGSKIAGLLGGLPSTVVIALFFIGYTQSTQVAAQATTVMPLAQGLNGLFVLSFMLFIERGLWQGIFGSLMVWLLQSTVLYLLDIQALWVSLVGWVVLLIFCYTVLQRWLKIPSQGKLEVTYPVSQLI